MCRIAYIPEPKGLGRGNMADLFAYLEKTQGGDGNGLAFSDRSGAIHTVKGVSLHTSFLAEMASKMDRPVLFHTRHSTVGPICDELCQPLVIDNTAFVHNGHWHGWDDVAMELLLNGDMDGHGPINDSLTAAALAIRHGRYSLEAIRTGVFVIMTPDEAWLHLRGGKFCFCESLGIYASDFPKDWPASKSIGDDAIARLRPDGPEFECGGYWKPRVFVGVTKHLYGGYTQQKAAEDDDKDDSEKVDATPSAADIEQSMKDLEEALVKWEEDNQDAEAGPKLEDLSDLELARQIEYPGLREFEYGVLANEWQRRQEQEYDVPDGMTDEELIEHWRWKYGIQ